MSTHNFTTADGDIIPIAYIKPSDLLQYVMTNCPDVWVCGLDSATDRAIHLEAFWRAYELAHGDHAVYKEHGNLCSCLPMLWHGDEGRGKRRGNTLVLSLQTPFSMRTVLNYKKRKRAECDCQPRAATIRKYGPATSQLSARHRDALKMQENTMKLHPFLHHFPLCILPSAIYPAHARVLDEILSILALDMRRLFFEGFDAGGKHYTGALIGAKGDLKWFKKIALERSYDNQGFVQNKACCHECGAGVDGLPYEDVASEVPCWANTRFQSRPWTVAPAMTPVPFCDAAPEKQYQKDIFNMTKVGIYRDCAGSTLCWLVLNGYFGTNGSFPEKLETAHGSFRLYCRTMGKTAALRSFTRALLMYPNFQAYPWFNTKGSDTMLLLSWLKVVCRGFENDVQAQGHTSMLQVMRGTCQAAIDVFALLNSHQLWTERWCTMMIHDNMVRFVKGYSELANRCLNDPFNGYSMKPKLHLYKHMILELHDSLSAGHELAISFQMTNCEPDEDLIGKVCRLSRIIDSRKVGERVLGCCLLKTAILHKRFRKNNKI